MSLPYWSKRKREQNIMRKIRKSCVPAAAPQLRYTRAGDICRFSRGSRNHAVLRTAAKQAVAPFRLRRFPPSREKRWPMSAQYARSLPVVVLALLLGLVAEAAPQNAEAKP